MSTGPEPVSHRAATPPRAGDLAIRVGAVVFAVGVLLILVDVVPFFFGHDNRPVPLNVGAYAAPLGLGIALFGLLRQARAAARRARADAAQR